MANFCLVFNQSQRINNMTRNSRTKIFLAVVMVVALASVVFDGTTTVRTQWSVSALAFPRQLPAAVHQTGRTRITSSYYRFISIGMAPSSMIQENSFKITTHYRIGGIKKKLLRQPSAIQLGPENNNMPGGGGGGSTDMDPGLKLLVCILIDFIGVASFAAPGLGEATDFGWAPISAFLVNYLFGNGIFTALALVEEISPGLDFIPTATIAWFFENANKESSVGPQPSESPSPPQYPSTTRKKNKPVESDVIDVDIIE